MAIQHIDDLRSEIIRLEVRKQELEIEMKPHFTSPTAIFHTVLSLFPKSHPASENFKASSFLNQDFVALASRFLLPFTLNKTLFKNSNFIIKAIVGMVSQRASAFINEESVTGTWGKVKGLFNKTFHKGTKPAVKPVVPKAPVTTPVGAPYGDTLTPAVIKVQDNAIKQQEK